jgi:hypothetical protein
MMDKSKSMLFWAEAVTSLVCLALAVLSIAWPDWIEALTGLAPDQGDGSAEWGLVLAFGAVAAVSAMLARLEWRRLRAA